MANPVQVCATLVLPEDSFSSEVVLPNPFVLPVHYTDGTAGNVASGSTELAIANAYI